MFVQLRKLPFVYLMVCQLCFTESSLSAGDQNGRGTKAVSLGNSFVAIADNPWAIAYNSAGLLQLRSIEISTFIVPHQFGLPELRTVSAAAAVPLGGPVVGFEVEQFGFDKYKESVVRLAAAMEIDNRLFGGLTMNLSRLSLGNYGATQATTFNVGLLANVREDIRIGFSAHNIFGARIGSTGERLPQVFFLGASYALLTDLMFIIEMEKDVRFPTMFKGGLEKTLFDFMMVRAGISNNPDKFSAGIGLRYGNVEFGYAGYSHIDLGWTHQVDLSFSLGGE